jgi:hypothetical protein
MSLSHVKRRAMSFVERPDNPDIAGNRLALGAENVHPYTSIDDKSS